MKQIIYAILLTILLPLNSLAGGINFSLTLTDDEGNLQPSTDTQLRLSLKTSATGNESMYIETQEVTSNPYAVVHTTFGDGTKVAGDWNDIDWGADQLYLQVERATPSGYILLNTIQIGAVPYAYHAEKAAALTLKSPNGTSWDVEVDNDGNLSTSMVAPDGSPEYGTVDYLFDLDALPSITIEITTEQWNELLHNYDLNPGNEECVHVNFYFNKYGKVHSLQDVGLRLRGNTSRVRPEGSTGEDHVPGRSIRHTHLGFRFQKFHKNDPDYMLSGTDRFNLRWPKGDPTFVHEVYGYDLMRRFGVYTAARSSFCMVYLKFVEEEKPIYMGISEMFECYDDAYLADHTSYGDFAGTGGFLWKGGWSALDGNWYGADFAHPYRGLMGIAVATLDPAETEDYAYDYKSKKKKLEEAKDQLETFITNLNTLQGDEFRTWAEGAIDVDLLLRAMAVEAAIGHWDDFWCNGNNFYAYFDNDGDGRLRYIPYDMDNTLGVSGSFDVGTKNPLKWGHSPLANKLLTIPEWRERYIDYLFELADENNDLFDPAKSAARITTWHDLIRDHVKNDCGVDNWLNDSPGWGETQQYRLLDEENNYFSTRIEAIRQLRP